MRRLGLLVMIAACGRHSFTPLADSAGSGQGDSGTDAFVDPLVFACGFDEATGPYSCGSLLATCTTTCPTSITSNHTKGLTFSGGQDVQLGTTTINSTGYTVSLWFRVDNTVFGALVSKPFDGTTLLDTFSLFVSNSNGQLYYETTDGMAAARTSNSVDLRDNQWHHGAASWDGTTKRLYVDGVFVSQEAVPPVDSSQSIIIGGDRDNGAPGFRLIGSLDELRVYSRALSATEIAALAQ